MTKEKIEIADIKKEMERIKIPETVIAKYEEGTILVSDLVDKKSCPIEDDHKIKGSAEALKFLVETEVLHVVRTKEEELGNVLIYILYPKEKDFDGVYVYKVHTESPINCDFDNIKIGELEFIV